MNLGIAKLNESNLPAGTDNSKFPFLVIHLTLQIYNYF
jgi:hypothetical protein